MSGEPTKKDDDADLEMRDHYDFSKGVRGKYADRFTKGSKVVILDPDVAAEYESSEDVNAVLRSKIAERRRSGA